MRAGPVVRRFAAVAVVVSAAGLAPAPAAAADPAAGSAAAGRELFIGVRALSAGGAPCGACHALGGEGLAFTASLGPELSTGLAGMDPVALDGLLETLPFPSMTPVYEGRALTAGERADLAAFLLAAAPQGPPRGAWHLEAWAAALAVGLFLGLALAWRRRKLPSRARLVARAARPLGGSR
jgi:mono/diheme cytochrome c family protein